MSDQYLAKGTDCCPECEEKSFCNSEGREIETPYMREGCHCPDSDTEPKKQPLSKLCSGMKNPYFKQTCSIRTDVYRKKDDESPVDTISMEHSASASLSALMIAGGLMLGGMLLCKILGKKS